MTLSGGEVIALIGLAAALGLSACSAAAPAPQTGAAAPGHRSASPAGTAGPGTPGPAAPVRVTIAAVGDTMLGDTPDLPPDPVTYLDAVKRTLDSGAQIVFGNLEGTLTTATASKCGPGGQSSDSFAFRAPPRYARYLKDAGFTVLNNANNHSYDFGAAGQAQTVQAIHAAGLAQTGLPGEITTVRVRGVAVAFVAFAPYDLDASLLDVRAARALIKQAVRQASVVVVYMHAGAEGSDADHGTGHEYFSTARTGDAEAFAHMATGATPAWSSQERPARGARMQFLPGLTIAYSLGNFAGYNNFGTDGDLDLSVILHVTLSSAGRFERARIYPVRFTAQGQPVPGGGAVPLIARLSAEDFGRAAARILPSGAVRAP